MLVDIARRRLVGPWRLRTVLRLELLLDWASKVGHLTAILLPKKKYMSLRCVVHFWYCIERGSAAGSLLFLYKHISPSLRSCFGGETIEFSHSAPELGQHARFFPHRLPTSSFRETVEISCLSPPSLPSTTSWLFSCADISKMEYRPPAVAAQQYWSGKRLCKLTW